MANETPQVSPAPWYTYEGFASGLQAFLDWRWEAFTLERLTRPDGVVTADEVSEKGDDDGEP